MNELSLFSGYGGFSLGLRLAGLDVRTVAYVEIETYCQEIIKARIKDGLLDDAPIWDDIHTFRGEQFRGLVGIITAGFPCQPHSTAGQRKGAEDERNLWPDTLRVIGEVGPEWVLLENVPGILTNGYAGTVVGQLSEIGYDCKWLVVSARDVGASHRRDRWWVLAHARSDGCIWNQPTPGRQQSGGRRTSRGKPESSNCTVAFPPGPGESERWAEVLREHPELAPAIESPVRNLADGTPNRVDRLRALGNGIVPAVVAEFLRRIA